MNITYVIKIIFSSSASSSLGTSETVQHISFTDAEVEHFERQYTEGHNLTGDIRYNQWLQVAHPDTTFLAHQPNVSQGTVGHLIQ